MPIFTRRRITELGKEYGFRPDRRLGQNFLTDGNILRKILSLFPVGPDDTVIEIGPGLGQMTFELARRAKRVIAVEIDRAFVNFLKGQAAGLCNLEIIGGDFLEFEPEPLAAGKKYKVISNLPYSISSPAVTRLIEGRRLISAACLMLQKEVAERMTASPGNKDYGALSVFTQFFCEADRLFAVKRSCFYPSPKVGSSVVMLKMRELPAVRVRDADIFFKVVRAAFSKRRKTLLNSISGFEAIGVDRPAASAILEACGIDPARRGETLSLDEFARIADALAQR